MSVRFERFVKRIGKKSEFLPFRNRLLDAMVEDAKAKYKNYPLLIEKMSDKWINENYEEKKAISHLLRDYIEDFFMFYMKTIFPFTNKGLKVTDVSTPSRLDFIITTVYRYNPKEIRIIKKLLEETEFPKNPDIEKICKFLLLYTVNSFAVPVHEVFKGPFAFMPQKVEAKRLDDGSIEVSVSVQGREQ